MISKLNFFFINNDIISILYLVYTYKRFKMRFQKKLNAYLFSLVFPIKKKKKRNFGRRYLEHPVKF